MTKYQEWNNSRWNYTKNISNYKFTTTERDKFTDVAQLCENLDFDYNYFIEKYDKLTEYKSWGDRNFRDDLYTESAEESDLINAGADPKQKIFGRYNLSGDKLAVDIGKDILGLENFEVKFHKQITGQMLHLHIDNFAGMKIRENSFKETEIDENPNIIRRFVIMLKDWDYGHIWHIGNTFWSHWKAGDVLTWEWKNIPHATANVGWSPRYMIQYTGFVTDKTYEYMKR